MVELAFVLFPHETPEPPTTRAIATAAARYLHRMTANSSRNNFRAPVAYNGCMCQCFVIPPDLLRRLAADAEQAERRTLLDTIRHDRELRKERKDRASLRGATAAIPAPAPNAKPNRAVYDQQGRADTSRTTLARAEGAKATKDVAVNEAYDGLGFTHKLFATQFGWNSIDGRGMALVGMVHYGQQYDNAFWDGNQMVFGDGDGKLFTRFTKSIDVIGHELTHGVTERIAGLRYSGQSGALNESVSDVFGSLVKQFRLNQTAATADWLIGADIVGPELSPALRSMKAPGTANKYDNQPADMTGYVKTSSDNGGVHTNSGIPNRAFYLVASKIGGAAWLDAGQIWWATLNDPALKPGSTFKSFATISVRQAGVLFGATSQQAAATLAAWKTVKVL
jgi:Zn-dependent metalloprotease